jgi:hypothetical protein
MFDILTYPKNKIKQKKKCLKSLVSEHFWLMVKLSSRFTTSSPLPEDLLEGPHPSAFFPNNQYNFKNSF